MARSRVELHTLLKNTLGSTNIYFDPPESFKLKFPCIVYSLDNNYLIKADNKNYIGMKRYTMIYITQNADDSMTDVLEDLDYCSLNRTYSSDNFYHYAYTIYF